MEQPLAGVNILDLTGKIAGPYCTKLLADFGADVIKIEDPDGGDPARKLGPFLNDEPHPEKSGLFLYLNTNKRGITLNLKCETGKRIFKEMVARADVLVESFTPQVMPSLGLEYETLERINPRLVMTSISDFGQKGPFRDFKGSELIYQGYGGPMYLTGNAEGGPLKRSGNVIQYQIGFVASVATMTSFYGAEVRGYGDHIDLDSNRAELISIDSKINMMTAFQYTGHTYRRSPSGGFTTLRMCKDGYVYVQAGWDGLFFEPTARVLGLTPEQIKEWAKPGVPMDPVKAGEFDEKYLTPWLLEHTREEIVNTLQSAGGMAASMNDTAGLLADPHFKERNYWVEIDHPVTGKLTYPGAPFRMAEGSWQIRRPAPLHGQHNMEVFGELGYTKEDLVVLRETEVI
jgi:CoA:oxalate CoA-transferase